MVKHVPGTTSAYAERVIGGYYLDIVPDRDALARYGLMIGNLQDTIAMALGGDTVTTTVEGRERYTVNVRYPRDLRSDPQAIARTCWCRCRAAARCRSARSPKSSRRRGPTTIRTENGELASLYLCRYAATAISAAMSPTRKRRWRTHVKFPHRHLRAVERPVRIYAARDRASCKIVVPLTLLIIFLLLYLNFGRFTETLIVMLSLPFALVGGLWLMWWLGFNLSVAVAVGFIALAGVAAETGVVMLIYLDQRLERDEGRMRGVKGVAIYARRSPSRHHAGRRRARAAEDDDGGRHHGGAASYHVEHRHRLRGDAAHCGADDRRDDLIDAPDPDRHPCRLCLDQGIWNAQAGECSKRRGRV